MATLNRHTHMVVTGNTAKTMLSEITEKQFTEKQLRLLESVKALQKSAQGVRIIGT